MLSLLHMTGHKCGSEDKSRTKTQHSQSMRCDDDCFQPCLSRQHWLHVRESLPVAPSLILDPMWACFAAIIMLITCLPMSTHMPDLHACCLGFLIRAGHHVSSLTGLHL
jgi:hypothetical protein